MEWTENLLQTTGTMGVRKFIILLSCKHSDQLITPKSVSASSHNSLGVVRTKNSRRVNMTVPPQLLTVPPTLNSWKESWRNGALYINMASSKAGVGTMMVTKAYGLRFAIEVLAIKLAFVPAFMNMSINYISLCSTNIRKIFFRNKITVLVT